MPRPFPACPCRLVDFEAHSSTFRLAGLVHLFTYTKQNGTGGGPQLPNPSKWAKTRGCFPSIFLVLTNEQSEVKRGSWRVRGSPLARCSSKQHTMAPRLLLPCLPGPGREWPAAGLSSSLATAFPFRRTRKDISSTITSRSRAAAASRGGTKQQWASESSRSKEEAERGEAKQQDQQQPLRWPRSRRMAASTLW